MKTILLATDGSELAKQAARYACALARLAPAVRVYVVYVTPELVYPDTLVVAEEYQQKEEEYFTSIQNDLSEVFQDCTGQVQYEHLYGRPA
ncbi:MAG: universal stress protein, partial [Alicyclobacillus sp.]|nr:universal stress protein [Alicyclobacillus sp.]